MGNDVPTTTTIAAVAFKSDRFLQQDRAGVTDHGGWAVNPMAGQNTPTAISDADLKTSQAQLNIVPLPNGTRR